MVTLYDLSIEFKYHPEELTRQIKHLKRMSLNKRIYERGIAEQRRALLCAVQYPETIKRQRRQCRTMQGFNQLYPSVYGTYWTRH